MIALLPEKDYLFDSIEGFEAEDYPLEGFKADGNSRPCTDVINDSVVIVPIWGMKPALQWMVTTPIREIP
ncbi:hypothetical protein C356_00237 [Cryptococcus neoformans c45]|nr:hypothetical protein C356_00237 [Cryptococcus neoformans var. grubii c45]